ncbi:MAG: hypothetical protein DRI86_04850 [Bacteroidetes bacterium]|nr:MAG: hypothetical protein DRI86_04850 [Bacteroidota bacterium]
MNKSINIQNYEEFLIDFIDGTLNEEEHAAVVMFLENNPDIAEEFNGIADFNLDFCNIELPNKESLKKSFDINLDNYEHYFIAAAEGDLNSDELIQLEEFIEQNPNLEKEYEVFQKLKLSLLEEVPELELNSIKKIELSNGEFVSELDFEKLCIAYFENDLVDNKKALIDSSIVGSEMAKVIFNDYSKLKLSADLDIIMPNKANMKKRVILPFIGQKAIYIPAVVASIAFLLIYYIFPDVNTKNSNYQIDNNNPIVSELVVTNESKPENTNLLSNEQIIDSNITDRKNVIVKSGIKSKEESIKIIKPVKKYISNSNTRISAYALERVETIACCENIGPDKYAIQNGMQLMMIRPELAYNEVDSGYFLVVAPKKESLIAKFVPKGFKKVGKQLGKVFSEKKAIIESEKSFNTFESIAQVALDGFNKMTESDYFFNRRQSTDNSDENTEKQK